MALISLPYVFTVGSTIVASQHNSNFNTIYNDYNGNITDSNIASNAAIGYAKLALNNSIQATDILSSTVFNIVNIPTGTSANEVVELDGSAKLPAVDGSALTGMAQNNFSSIKDYGTSNSTSTARVNSAVKIAYGHDISVSGASSVTISNLSFTSSSSYTIVVSANSSFGTPPAGTDQNSGNLVAVPSSGAAFVIYNTDDQAKTVAWIAIGI